MSNMTTARKNRLQIFMTVLTGKFPHCFSLAEPKPLSLNIQDAIKEKCPEVDCKLLAESLRYYVNRPAYKHGILKHPHRLTLDGRAADAVTTEEKEHAQLWLDNYGNMRKLKAERKAQSQKPPKPKPKPSKSMAKRLAVQKPQPKPPANKKGFAYPQKPAPAQPEPKKPIEVTSKFNRPILKFKRDENE